VKQAESLPILRGRESWIELRKKKINNDGLVTTTQHTGDAQISGEHEEGEQNAPLSL